MTGTLGISLLILTLIIVLASPMMAAIFAPKWFFDDSAKYAATADMLRITFPYLLFISMTGVAGGILNSYDRFAVPAFTPLLLNVTLIAAALVAAPLFAEPAYALAWGVFMAGVVQLMFQLPFLHRIHMLPTPKVDWQDSGVRKILTLMGPAIFGVSVSQINLLLDTVADGPRIGLPRLGCVRQRDRQREGHVLLTVEVKLEAAHGIYGLHRR